MDEDKCSHIFTSSTNSKNISCNFIHIEADWEKLNHYRHVLSENAILIAPNLTTHRAVRRISAGAAVCDPLEMLVMMYSYLLTSLSSR